MTTNPFITKATNAEDVDKLVKGLDRYMPDGKANTKLIQDESPIKYSRAWLILRHEYLSAHVPSAFVQPTKTEVEKARKTFSATDPKWELRHVYGPIVQVMHDDKNLSWGEIMVRTGKNEGFVRKAYEACDGQRRTVGLRTGKGGRFAADRPDLYQENRRAEGAEIPNEKGVYASTVPVEMLLNYTAPEGAVKAKAKA